MSLLFAMHVMHVATRAMQFAKWVMHAAKHAQESTIRGL